MPIVRQVALAGQGVIDSSKLAHCAAHTFHIAHNLKSIITDIFKENALPWSEID